MRKIFSTVKEQRGQVILLFVGLFAVITALGVITIDFGLWFSERRGSQTDADMVALAGATDCMLQLSSNGAYTADVPAVTQLAFDKNNEAGNATLDPPASSLSCERQSDGRLCVFVGIHHSSRALFGSIFNQIAPDIGAHAKACAGGVNAPGNTIPVDAYAVCQETSPPTAGPCFNNDGTPKFGELCGLEFGAHGPSGGGNCNNPRGLLDLQAPPGYCSDPGGSGSPYSLITDGIPGVCLINADGSCGSSPWYDCAATQTGNPQNVIDGFNARIMKNHICDDNFHDPQGVNNVDDLSESVEPMPSPTPPGQAGVSIPRDCDPSQPGEQISQRLVSIIVFDDYPSSNNTGYPIKAFGGFYIKGCTTDVANCTDPNYNWSVDELNCNMHGQIGQAVVCGQFLRLIMTNAAVGGVDSSTTSFGVALCDWEPGGSCEGSGGPPRPTRTPLPTRPPTSTPCKGNPHDCPATNTPWPTDTPTPRPPTATNTPVPTATPTRPPTHTPTPCPTQCNSQGKGCKPVCS